MGDSVQDEVKRAKRRLWAGLMAVKPKLDDPYPDDPRWTPWTRFIGPRLDDLWAAFDALMTAATARPEAEVKAEALRDAAEIFRARPEYAAMTTKYDVSSWLRKRADELEGES